MHIGIGIFGVALAASLLAAGAPAGAPAGAGQAQEGPWDARAAEHLLNRAGFGAGQAEVERAVEIGREAAIDELFTARPGIPPPQILGEEAQHYGIEPPAVRHRFLLGRREGHVRTQVDRISPLARFGDWWVERMLAGDDPVRDRMAIFWHGHLVSSIQDVADPYMMIAQVRFLRENALGSYETLLGGIARDPAMLEYLDNASNVKTHPNENWARELMELFALGDGNYTETDIREAARAFTGWTQEERAFANRRVDHDYGQKTVLGVAGNLDGDHVIDIVLDQPACGLFLARKIIAHFEGVPPAEERAQAYARLFAENDYSIEVFLRRLFADPAFYRDEVVGARVSGPIEFMVGTARRAGLVPSGQLVLAAGDVLGQHLFWPPSVKGWEEGRAWITAGTMLHRSNMAGILLGVVDVASLLEDREFDEGALGAGGMMMADERETERKVRSKSFMLLRFVQEDGWRPRVALASRVVARAGPHPGDRAVVDALLSELLAVEPEPITSELATRELAHRRAELGLAEGEIAPGDERAERLLARLAHLILSSPEAQLN